MTARATKNSARGTAPRSTDGSDGSIEPRPVDPSRCATCGDHWVTRDGKWSICIDCPHKSVTDIGPDREPEVSVSIDLGHLIAFLQALHNRLV